MDNKNQQAIDANMIIKILYKDKALIALKTILVVIISTIFVFVHKSFNYLKKNSKTLKNVNLPDDKFLKEMTTRLTAQSETNDPMVKVKFSTNSKSEGENFAKEYPILAQNYLLERKNNFLDSQIKLLEQQYSFLTKNVDIRTTKDSLTDTLVSRLAYYRLLKNDPNPVVKFINSTTKPSLNKKLVIAGSLFLGIFLGILIAFMKEFSTTLDWEDIKKRKN